MLLFQDCCGRMFFRHCDVHWFLQAARLKNISCARSHMVMGECALWPTVSEAAFTSTHQTLTSYNCWVTKKQRETYLLFKYTLLRNCAIEFVRSGTSQRTRENVKPPPQKVRLQWSQWSGPPIQNDRVWSPWWIDVDFKATICVIISVKSQPPLYHK